jgi:hypothetical protein
MESEGVIPINHTPHNIAIYKDNKIVYTFYSACVTPDKPPLRVLEVDNKQQDRKSLALPNGAEVPLEPPPVYSNLSHSVSGSILVSQVVAQFITQWSYLLQEHGITHVYCPDTGPNSVVRNERGEIVGVKRLIQYI